VANSRPWQWRYTTIEGRWISGGYSASIWGGSNGFTTSGPINVGDTIIETRLDGYMSFGTEQQSMSSSPLQGLWYSEMYVRYGVYAKKTQVLSTNPPSVVTNDSDGGWIMQGFMVPLMINHWDNGTGALSQEIIFGFPGGTAVSKGRRGPYSANPAGAYFCWDFYSPTLFWQLNDSNFNGYGGGSILLTLGIEEA
jgi:hypothetical protein